MAGGGKSPAPTTVPYMYSLFLQIRTGCPKGGGIIFKYPNWASYKSGGRNILRPPLEYAKSKLCYE